VQSRKWHKKGRLNGAFKRPFLRQRYNCALRFFCVVVGLLWRCVCVLLCVQRGKNKALQSKIKVKSKESPVLSFKNSSKIQANVYFVFCPISISRCFSTRTNAHVCIIHFMPLKGMAFNYTNVWLVDANS